ncbi:MAG TPA: lysophospholipid acyltransferase family protein [Bacteroidia bacterium]|nr:lysophospholipid acyltransferase family protein [Bacteroidia bacterium]
MGAVLYYAVLPLLYLISLLPFRALYILSDGMYFLIYKVLGYRTKVVLQNLRNSFPEKTEAEIQAITKKFYRYFCDLILETIKTITISPASVKRHVQFDDISLFKQYQEQNQSVIIVMGHFGNWELGGARFAVEPIHKLYVIYHPLSNKYFEKLIVHMRTRLGNRLYAMKDVLRGMVQNRSELTATAFIADQTPSNEGAYWMEFLNQDTPVFTGTEKLSRKFKYPVIYLTIKRAKRGLYKMECELLTEHPENTSDNEISALHTKRLEKDILEQPEIWLWTHRRWKHKRKQPKPIYS